MIWSSLGHAVNWGNHEWGPSQIQVAPAQVGRASVRFTPERESRLRIGVSAEESEPARTGQSVY